MAGQYLDTDTLFKSIVPAASARVDAGNLISVLEHVLSIAASGDRIEFSFEGIGLAVRCESENGTANTMLAAEVALTSNESYCYDPKNLINCAKMLRGMVMLNFTKDGMLELQNDNMRFFQLPVRTKAVTKPKKSPRKKAA